MAKKKERKELAPKKDWLNRWMYNEKELTSLLKMMPLKRQVKILNKAMKIMSEKGYSKTYAIASALDCGYDDAGYYYRKNKIRI